MIETVLHQIRNVKKNVLCVPVGFTINTEGDEPEGFLPVDEDSPVPINTELLNDVQGN